MIKDYKVALDALHWIVTNGQFTEQQTERLTLSLQTVEQALQLAQEHERVCKERDEALEACRMFLQSIEGQFIDEKHRREMQRGAKRKCIKLAKKVSENGNA